MQLTNYSAIDLRHGAAKVLDDRDHSIRRITTGERLARASDDPGGLAVAMKQDVVNNHRSALRTILQNARTYVEAQGEAFVAAVPRADLTLIEGGHMIPVTQPDTVADWIRERAIDFRSERPE